MARRPAGYWQNYENCEREIRGLAESEMWESVPSVFSIERKGINRAGITTLGNCEGISKLLGLPLKNPKGNSRKQANQPALEKWTGKPSKAFEIEAEARKVGLSYADIQKAKTLELVGGIQI